MNKTDYDQLKEELLKVVNTNTCLNGDNGESFIKELQKALDNLEDSITKKEEKKRLIDLVNQNINNFYGSNIEKLSKNITVIRIASENIITQLIDRGYMIDVVSGPYSILKKYVPKEQRIELYCTPREINDIENLFEYLEENFREKEHYKIYFYLPFYKDFNDNKVKTSFAFTYWNI